MSGKQQNFNAEQGWAPHSPSGALAELTLRTMQKKSPVFPATATTIPIRSNLIKYVKRNRILMFRIKGKHNTKIRVIKT